MKLQLKIILVETSHPGNIGASARAMKNMGVHELVLVNPQCYPHEDAFSRASGAEDILERAEIKHSLKEAIKDCNFVAAATARSENGSGLRHVGKPWCGSANAIGRINWHQLHPL